ISASLPVGRPSPSLQIPSTRHHPCSVRGVHPLPPDVDAAIARQKDLHQLVKKCQRHAHSNTCYKYWKGPPHPKECRFDLSAENVRPESTINDETGEICLRCLDGLVNNFNSTILEAIRCNMDIKFIGTGASAKAVLHYITDYITKSQLKTHVAYAALELAVSKLAAYNPITDDIAMRGKKLLQKCAYAMLAKQEMSAQQVCSYLMDLEDHFTSHEYQNLYWTSFEAFLNTEDPSPECYATPQVNARDAYGAGLGTSSPDDVSSERNIPAAEESTPVLPDEESDNEDELVTGIDAHSADDVAVGVNSDGKLVAKAAQVADYQMRAPELSDICL
ncbi:hypothetical protein FA95DRAFT_1477203, partial [Auriscalpium vulgare]